MKWWWTKRQYDKSFRPRRHRRRYVVRKVVGQQVYGYWCGSERYNGVGFTDDIRRAFVCPSRKVAQANADNTMLYRHANYRVERVRKAR